MRVRRRTKVPAVGTAVEKFVQLHVVERAGIEPGSFCKWLVSAWGSAADGLGVSGPSFRTEMFDGHGGKVIPSYLFMGRAFDLTTL